ncbi:MAG: hypothetical protein L0H94_01360 [Nitrospira sp.]|nr:hypothetical protein [Nitrospira sp.]
MSTELESAKGSPRVFTITSNDVFGVVDTADFFDIIDTMDFTLPKKRLLTISYSAEIEIAAPAQNNNVFQGVFILCTLDPPAILDQGGVDCPPIRGVPFGNNFGLNPAIRYHGVHSFTWVVRVNAGPHKIVMRGTRRPDSEPPGIVIGPEIVKRTLVVQAFPI